MWENETVVLATSLRKRLLGDSQNVRYGKITNDTAIPVFIKAQFQKRIERYLQQESPLTLHNTTHFQFREEELALLRSRFMDAFRETATFDVKEVDQILQEALTIKLDYLVKPSATMRKLMYNGKTTLPLKTLEEVLSPFTNVLPYAETLIKFCRNRQLSALELDQYGPMMEQVFNEVFAGHEIQAVLNDLSVLHEFLSETKGETIVKSDGNLLLDFFSDRNMWGYRRAVEVEMKLGRADFDSVSIEMTLKRYEALKQDFPTAQETVQSAPVEKILEPEPQIEPDDDFSFDLDSVTLDEPEEPVQVPVRNKQEEEDIKAVLNDIMGETSEEKTEKRSVSLPEKEESESDGIWDLEDVLGEDSFGKPTGKDSLEKKAEVNKPQNMGLVRREKEEELTGSEDILDDVKAKPDKGLSGYISDKTKKGFVKKLFNGDDAAYDELIEKLDEAESWRVAKILIDNELFKRDVDPFSREAIRLVDMVYSRYYPEEGVGGA